MQKRPRQIDVAKLAGVSPATVSVILNNRRDSNVRVSAETRTRVLAAIEQLGYVADPVAQSLAGGHNSILGLFTGEPIFPSPRSKYFPLLVGIEQAAGELGYDLLLFTHINKPAHRSQIYHGNVNRLRVANGAILLGVELSNAEHTREFEQLIAEQYPFVCVGNGKWADSPFSYVAADCAAATMHIVTEMLLHGHRQIAYVGSWQENELHSTCYGGYLMAHRQLGLAQSARPAQQLSAMQLTPDFVQQALDQGTTAFVLESANDLITAFFQALAELDKRAPTDLSFALLGDPAVAIAAPYPVTRFVIPHEQMGRRAVNLLVELLEIPRSRHTALPQARQEALPCIPIPGITIASPPNLL